MKDIVEKFDITVWNGRTLARNIEEVPLYCVNNCLCPNIEATARKWEHFSSHFFSYRMYSNDYILAKREGPDSRPVRSLLAGKGIAQAGQAGGCRCRCRGSGGGCRGGCWGRGVGRVVKNSNSTEYLFRREDCCRSKLKTLRKLLQHNYIHFVLLNSTKQLFRNCNSRNIP